MLEKTYAATLDKIPEMLGFVSETAETMGVHPKRIMHLELAMEEAVVNICNYAYAIPPGEVTVRISQEAETFKIELIDNGVPFDPMGMDAPDIKSEIENRDVGGLGILLIRRMLDEVRYSRQADQNILMLAIHNVEK